MLCLGLHGLCRVYTEQFRSTQSLHRANPVNTESTQSNLGSTQSLHRAMRTYTGSTQNNMRSTQSLHRLIQCLHRVYTEQYIYTESTQNSTGVYTESTQNNADLHRVYTEQNGVYTESTQSNAYVHSWTYYTTLLIFRKSSIVLTVFPLKFKYKWYLIRFEIGCGITIWEATPSKQKSTSVFRGVVTGVAGLAFATPAFEKAKGTCIKMLHLKYIFTP